MVNIPAAHLVLPIAVIVLSSSAAADVVRVDEFKVFSDGNLIFADAFDGGGPPPSAPNFVVSGNPASYSVFGGLSESDGKLIMDSALARISPLVIPAGSTRVNEAVLSTNIRPISEFPLGLKINHTFEASATFDLSLPSSVGERYGVTFSDSYGSPTPNDAVSLSITQISDGSYGIAFRKRDFANATITTIGFEALLMGFDQIRLTLSRLDLASNAITGSYTYLDDSVAGPSFTFSGTGSIFTGETWTQAGLLQAVQVPEPAGAILMVNLISLWAIRGRRKESRDDGR